MATPTVDEEKSSNSQKGRDKRANLREIREVIELFTRSQTCVVCSPIIYTQYIHQIWAQSGLDWSQMGQIRGFFFRSDSVHFGLAPNVTNPGIFFRSDSVYFGSLWVDI